MVYLFWRVNSERVVVKWIWDGSRKNPESDVSRPRKQPGTKRHSPLDQSWTHASSIFVYFMQRISRVVPCLAPWKLSFHSPMHPKRFSWPNSIDAVSFSSLCSLAGSPSPLAHGVVQSSSAAREGNWAILTPSRLWSLEPLDRFSDIGLLCEATDVIPFGSCRFPRSGDVLNILDVYISRTFLMALEIISFFHVFDVRNLQTAIRSPEIRPDVCFRAG